MNKGSPSSSPSWKQKLCTLIECATRAPSSHNTQPWRFVVNDDSIDLLADRSKSLPVVDPYDRSLIISCGACLHHLREAMVHAGLDPKISFFPSTDEQPDWLAHISFQGKPIEDFEKTERWQRFYDLVSSRHSHRFSFENRKILPNIRKEILDTAKRSSNNVSLIPIQDNSTKTKISSFIAECDRIQFANPQFRRELATWLNPNKSPRREGMPAYAFGIGDITSHFSKLFIRNFDIGRSQGNKDQKLALNSPLLIALATEQDTSVAWLETGIVLSNLLLHVTESRLAASFMNQPIEVDQYRPQLASLLNTKNKPQILLRIGHPNSHHSRPVPRRPVEQVISTN